MADDMKLPRILIIEDEPMLAIDIEETLTEAGYVVAGIAGELTKAMALIKDCDYEAAIVDANLAGVSAGPAARSLTARGIPFVVLSGYSEAQQSDDFVGARRLQKPCRSSQLIAALKDVVKR